MTSNAMQWGVFGLVSFLVCVALNCRGFGREASVALSLRREPAQGV
ncbi:hypothetical protein [Phenylobacterium sp.]|nr:hypothetical protein [Phenylobacterium sp.]